MLVRDWMNKEPVTVSPETSVAKASHLMRVNGVEHLVVIDEQGKLVGQVSDKELQKVSPSTATTLDVYEIAHLLGKINVSKVMTTRVVELALEPWYTVEHAAAVMLKHRLSALPVVENGKVVGIMTQDDLFRVLTRITGIYQGGVVFSFELEDKEGIIKEVCDVIRKHEGRVLSILSTYSLGAEGMRHANIRVQLPEGKEHALAEELKSQYTVTSWVRAYPEDYQ